MTISTYLFFRNCKHSLRIRDRERRRSLWLVTQSVLHTSMGKDNSVTNQNDCRGNRVPRVSHFPAPGVGTRLLQGEAED